MLILTSVFTGVALITKYNFYSISSEEQYVKNPPVAFYNFPANKSFNKIVIPPIFNIKTHKPDAFNVIIYGDFDSVVNVKAKLIWNESNILDIKVNDNKFSKGKTYYDDKNSYFSTELKTLDIDVEQVQTLETIVEFDGIKGGVVENFYKKSSYVVKRDELFSNDLIMFLTYILNIFRGNIP